jgi:ankyrin repeat protein
MANTLHNNGGKTPESGAMADSGRSALRTARNGSVPDGPMAAGNRRTEALARAVAKGDLESVEQLMKEGAKATPRILQICAGVMDNAFLGRPDAAKRFIASAGSINYKGDDGKTPLMRAARDDSVGIVRVILDLGARVDMKDRIGETALMKAAREGRTEIVDLLLERGADAHAKDRNGWTAWKLAILWNHEETASRLPKPQADEPKAVDEQEQMDARLLETAETGDFDSVRGLVERGASVEAKDDKGRTPLSWAAHRGETGTAEFLIAKGAEVDAADADNQTPLVLAIVEGKARTAASLLERGARVDTRDGEGGTVLMKAAVWCDGTVEQLLARGADVNAVDNDGRTALMNAACDAPASIARMLMERGAGVDAQSKYGETALTMAAARGREDVVELLLAAGADAKIKEQGMTALEIAVHGKREGVAEILRRHETK